MELEPREVSVALVGIGGYGQFYVDTLLAEGREHRLRFVGAADPHPERCERRAVLQTAAIPIFADLDTLLERHQPELIIVAAPIHLHRQLTGQALAAGAHVLCEKPVAATLSDARAMATAGRAAGRIVAIGYQWSYSDPIQALKRDVLAGAFGRPLRLKTLVCWPRPAEYYARNDWAGRLRAPSGEWVRDSPLNNAHAHYLHAMFYLLGQTRETSAQPAWLQAELYRAKPIETYDTIALRCRTTDDVDILFLSTHAVLAERGPILEYVFEHATLRFDNAGWDPQSGFRAEFRDGRVKDYGNPEQTPAQKLWQTADAIRGEASVACDVEAALPQVICVQAAQTSAPVTPFPAECIQTTTLDDPWHGGRHTWVAGLADVLEQCYAQGEMPSDTRAPWAIPGLPMPEPDDWIDTKLDGGTGCS